MYPLSWRVNDMDVDSLGREDFREGEGDREGSRDDDVEAGVLWPDEKEDNDRVRKNGEEGGGSGVPSSSAYRT